MTGKTDRHYRQRLHLWVKSCQIADGLFETGAVVYSRAEHNLGMHADAGLSQIPHDIQNGDNA